MKRVSRIVLTVLFAVAAAPPVYPQVAKPDQGRKPVAVADTAMVSSSHPVVTDAMLNVLRNGGNAVDAAITAVILQTVIEPQMTTLAGSMAMVYYEAETGKLYHLDGKVDHTRENAPTTLGSTWIQRGEPAGVPDTDGRRIAVPGIVAGLHAAAERFGSLQWADYFSPAISTAEQGFPMYSFLYGEMAEAAQGRLSAYPSGRAEYLPKGYVPPVGTLVTRPRLAESMKKLAERGPDYFYKGEWAQKFVTAARNLGSGITLEELAGYRARWEEPLRTTFRGYEIIGAPPPATGGTLIAMVLNNLEPFDLASMPPPAQSARSFALVRKAFTLADFNSEAFVRDPLGFNVPIDTLLSKELGAMSAKLIDASWPKSAPAAKTSAITIDAAKPEELIAMNTNHLVAVDGKGNWVSLTHTVNGGTFAIGLVVDGIQTNAANAFPGTNLGNGRRAPGPFPPTIIMKDNKPYLAIGSPGLSSRAVAQVLVNHLGFGMDLTAAIEAPRFSGSLPGKPTVIESRLAPGVMQELAAYDIPVKASAPFDWHMGSIHAIQRGADGRLHGYADLRRGGIAAGY